MAVLATVSVLVTFCVPTDVVTMEYLEDCEIVSDWPLTCLSHDMAGRGRPLAEQVNVAVLDCTATWS